MAQSPIVVVATDKLEHSITIAMKDDVRIEYFLVPGAYYWIKDKMPSWLGDGWYNHAVSALTKNAVEIKVRKPEPAQPSPPPWMEIDYSAVERRILMYEGMITGRWSSVKQWEHLREKGHNLEEIGRMIYGSSNWYKPNLNQEITMAKSGGDHKELPDAQYRFTVIAPSAQSFHYHQKRRWYKSEEDAKENAASVLEDTTADIELAVVECKDVFKRKPKVELMSVFKRSRR